MDKITIRKALLWCTIINYGLLIVWFLVFWLAHDWMHMVHANLFHVSVEQFDLINYGGILLFKVGILLLNLVPCIALYLV
jgi:hypothetical protein